MRQVQGRGLLLQGVPGGRPGRPRRAQRAAPARQLLLAHPPPVPPQTAAWKAGHKHECGTTGKETAKLYYRVQELQDARDWRGLVALEKEALALARELRGAQPAATNAILHALGLGFENTGEYGRARELHEQRKAMAEALGDRAGVAMACSSLGICYLSTGDYGRARELHEQDRAICEALGDRAGVAGACGNLGLCYDSTGDYATALTFFKTQHAIATELKLAHVQRHAALSMGATLGLRVRADRQAEAEYLLAEGVNKNLASPALVVGAAVEIHSLQKSPELNGVHGEIIKSQDLGTGRCGVKTATGRELALKPVNLRLIGALNGPTAGASREDRVQEAATWLKIAHAAGNRVASMHLAHLAFDEGQEDTALGHLKDYISWRVEQGRNWCDGCDQKRGEDAPMLMCGGCRVARFCSADHQKMASRRVASGGSLWSGRHKDICGLLGKWRGVEKDGVSPDALHADLLAFLRQ